MTGQKDIAGLLGGGASAAPRAEDVPVEHLDYAYVRQCTDAREVELILEILRSGKEGEFALMLVPFRNLFAIFNCNFSYIFSHIGRPLPRA